MLMEVPTTDNLSTTLVAVAVILLLVKSTWSLPGKSTKNKPPSPSTGLPYLGDFLGYTKDPIRFIGKVTTKYGRVFRLKLPFMNVLYLRGAQLNRMYVDVKEDTWSFGGGVGIFLRQLAKPGYFSHFQTMSSSIMRGVNRKEALNHYAGLIDEEVFKTLREWSTQPDFKLFEETSRFVHRVIVRCLMGQDFYDNHTRELYEIELTMENNVGHPLNFLLPGWIPNPPARRLGKARARFMEIFHSQMDHRRRNPESWKGSLDYITYTLEDPRTSHLQEFFPSHHIFLMFAAHTSVVANVAWTILELIRHPEYLTTLRESLQAHEQNPHQSLELLAAIKETNRHYTSMHSFRTTQKPLDLPTPNGDTFSVPPNWVVSMSLYMTHHDPEVFLDPDQWIPERWLQEDPRLRNLYNADEAAFMPFGGGCHRCPGENLAGIIARTMVASLVKNYDFGWGNRGEPSHISLDFSRLSNPWMKGDVSITAQKMG
ncbi:cytochrome P450 [Aspergillus californicus]